MVGSFGVIRAIFSFLRPYGNFLAWDLSAKNFQIQVVMALAITTLEGYSYMQQAHRLSSIRTFCHIYCAHYLQKGVTGRNQIKMQGLNRVKLFKLASVFVLAMLTIATAVP